MSQSATVCCVSAADSSLHLRCHAALPNGEMSLSGNNFVQSFQTDASDHCTSDILLTLLDLAFGRSRTKKKH